MRRRRTKRNHLSVSLFPFLAVLICTLGVLIVMLVMAVKSADDQAVQVQSDDDSEKLSKIATLTDQRDLQQFKIRGIESVRPKILERLGLARNNRSYLEDQIRKLNREFEQVNEELIELDRQSNQPTSKPAVVSESETQALLQELESRIAAAAEDLEQRRADVEQSGPATYVIVPHKGGGGTFRRPIYIECTGDAITLQPSGIRLEKKEFAPPLSAGNMLDSALLANREYWLRYDLAGEHGSPYPLIVVRPDGAETFVIARRAMQSWDDEFGYELVTADKELDFGKRDPQLEQELQEAIEEARLRQRAGQIAFARAARQQRAAQFASHQMRPGLTASSRSGGFVSDAGDNEFGQDRSARGERFPEAQQESTLADNSRNENDQPTNRKSSQTANQNSAKGVGGDLAIQNPYADLSLAQKRGSNWALPSKSHGATGYLRPIRLVCHPDYLELRSTNGQDKRISMMDRPTQAAVDPLVEEIWKKIESWGISGANSYWKPQLRVSVLPGGEQRFSEINGLLYQSGLLVEQLR